MSTPSSWEKAKMSDVVSKAQAELSKAMPSRNVLSKAVDWYYRTYFKTGKPQPLIHIMLAVGTIGYAIEYPHLKHEIEHAQKHASE